MASPLSILKNIVNLNHMHVESCKECCIPVRKFGQIAMQKQIHIHARPYLREQCLCPICHKKCIRDGHKHQSESWWRAPNLNGIPVFIFYRPQRIYCEEHGALNEYIPWADGDSRFTAEFNNEVAWLVCQMNKTAIAAYLGINWRTVGNCIQAAHQRIEPDVSERLHGLRRICVDETSYGVGHQYITVVYDMDRNRVVWVHDKHGRDVFEMFCKQLTPEEREKIEIVAGDGARWIDSCVKDFLPNAIRCVDFFHVTEWVNEALDKVRIATAGKAVKEYERRKAELAEAEKQAAEAADAIRQNRISAEEELSRMPNRGRPSRRKKELLAFLAETAPTEEAAAKDARRPGRPAKERLSEEHQELLDSLWKDVSAVRGAKHALGHNPENRTSNQNDTVKLIENSYPDLYKALQMKEGLRLILHMKDHEQAAAALSQWIDDAGICNLQPMVKLSEKIQRHYDNIINAIAYRVNSAKSESTNTTIKTLIKMARGFRNLDNMTALIYLKCSDLVIPLNNRIQPSAEFLAKQRDAANARRRAREEEKRMQIAAA